MWTRFSRNCEKYENAQSHLFRFHSKINSCGFYCSCLLVLVGKKISSNFLVMEIEWKYKSYDLLVCLFGRPMFREVKMFNRKTKKIKSWRRNACDSFLCLGVSSCFKMLHMDFTSSCFLQAGSCLNSFLSRVPLASFKWRWWSIWIEMKLQNRQNETQFCSQTAFFQFFPGTFSFYHYKLHKKRIERKT